MDLTYYQSTFTWWVFVVSFIAGIPCVALYLAAVRYKRRLHRQYNNVAGLALFVGCAAGITAVCSGVAWETAGVASADQVSHAAHRAYGVDITMVNHKPSTYQNAGDLNGRAVIVRTASSTHRECHLDVTDSQPGVRPWSPALGRSHVVIMCGGKELSKAQ